MYSCRACDILLDDNTQNISDKNDGNYICKTCKMSQRKARREELRNEDPIRYKCRQMRAGAMARAKANNVPFDISEDFLMSIAPMKCPVFGFVLKYSSRQQADDSASLDRIKPDRGYVEGNVQIISMLANTMKNSASKHQLFKFAKWIISNH